MKISSARFITTTAMLLALTIVFQMLRVIIPVLALPTNLVFAQILVGSLVNLCLIVATAVAGVWSGVIISVAAPLVSLAQGHIALPWMVPFVIIGNALIVIIYALLKKRSQILGFAVGGVVKTAFLWIGIVIVGVSLFGAPQKVAATLAISFTWLQLVTAIIGGLISLPVVRALSKKQAE